MSLQIISTPIKDELEEFDKFHKYFFKESYTEVNITTESKKSITFSEFLEEDTSHFINVKV
mgnify:CR=1 FL=1